MKYIGICSEGYFYTTENIRYEKIFGYLEDGTEIIILYDKNILFQINQIAIFLENSEFYNMSMYSLWSYEYFSENKEECLSISKHFACEITKFLKDVFRYYKESNNHK